MKFKLKTLFSNPQKAITWPDRIAIEYSSLFEYLPITEVIERIKESDQQFYPIVGFSGEIKGILKLSDLADFILSTPDDEKINLRSYFINYLRIYETETIDCNATYDEIKEKYLRSEFKVIPVVDETNRYLEKCITAKSLLVSEQFSNRPKSVGGLATPIGVYMTDGHFATGAGIPGLILTGVLFSFILNSITLFSIQIMNLCPIPESLLLILQLVIFILILKISPLSGLHAAEHQTIHAIEKGLDLTIENVKLQPRAHIRCGTNYMMLLMSFSLLISLYYDFLDKQDFFLQTFFVATLTGIILWNWRKAGESLQNILTTTEATDKQLESGIKAGKELLNKYACCPIPPQIHPLEKIWNMGLIQIIAAFSLTTILFHIIIFF